jgi:hypothetical protein
MERKKIGKRLTEAKTYAEAEDGSLIFQYVVHSDIDENNYGQIFDNEEEAIEFAKENISDCTYVDRVAYEDGSDIPLADSAECVWNYADEQAGEYPDYPDVSEDLIEDEEEEYPEVKDFDTEEDAHPVKYFPKGGSDFEDVWNSLQDLHTSDDEEENEEGHETNSYKLDIDHAVEYPFDVEYDNIEDENTCTDGECSVTFTQKDVEKAKEDPSAFVADMVKDVFNKMGIEDYNIEVDVVPDDSTEGKTEVIVKAEVPEGEEIPEDGKVKVEINDDTKVDAEEVNLDDEEAEEEDKEDVDECLTEAIGTDYPVQAVPEDKLLDVIKQIPVSAKNAPTVFFQVGVATGVPVAAAYNGGRGSEGKPVVRIIKLTEFTGFTGTPYSNLTDTKDRFDAKAKLNIVVQQRGPITTPVDDPELANKVVKGMKGDYQLIAGVAKRPNTANGRAFYVSLNGEPFNKTPLADILQYLTPANQAKLSQPKVSSGDATLDRATDEAMYRTISLGNIYYFEVKDKRFSAKLGNSMSQFFKESKEEDIVTPGVKNEQELSGVDNAKYKSKENPVISYDDDMKNDMKKADLKEDINSIDPEIQALADKISAGGLTEDTHSKVAKPAGDKEAAYENAKKYADRDGKPYIYGWTQAGNDAKFFALNTPEKVTTDPKEAEKQFRAKNKSCNVVYVAYPSKSGI